MDLISRLAWGFEPQAAQTQNLSCPQMYGERDRGSPFSSRIQDQPQIMHNIAVIRPIKILRFQPPILPDQKH